MPKGDLLHRIVDKSIFKARLDSCTQKGKSAGFRLVFFEHPDYIILLSIYPKWGPKRADNIKP